MIPAPLAWFVMSRWLENFTYRVHIGAEVFITAFLMSCTIALVTVVHKAAKAALRNPVKSLRMD